MVVYPIIFIAIAIIPLVCALYFHFFTNIEYNSKNQKIRNNFIVLSVLMFFGLFLFCGLMMSSITHKEVRNFYITKISHQERYSKKIVYYVTVYAGKDSKGNSRYRRERRTKTEYYGPYYFAYSNSGMEYSITKEEYDKWKNIWGEKYIKTIQGSATFFTKPLDGKYFESFFDGKFENVYPKPEVHLYKNVLRNSNSVFGYKYGDGIKHPVDNGNTNGIISEISLTEKEIAEFANFNAIKGSLKQIHIITLITKNKANNALEMINKWGGLNKNELAVFIGVDNDKNIIWTDAHSWMDNTKCQNLIRDQIMMLKKFDANSIRNIYDDNIKYWNRKEFKDFDYINVTVPISCKIAFYIAVIIFVGYFAFLVYLTQKH